MPTDAPIFISLLVGTVLLIGALNFFPAVALGPIEQYATEPKQQVSSGMMYCCVRY